MTRVFLLIVCCFIVCSFFNAGKAQKKSPIDEYIIDDNYEDSMNIVRTYVRNNNFFLLKPKNLTKDYNLEGDVFNSLMWDTRMRYERFYFESDKALNFTDLWKDWIEQFKSIKEGKIYETTMPKVPLEAFKIMCCDENVGKVGCGQKFQNDTKIYKYYCMFSSGDFDSYYKKYRK